MINIYIILTVSANLLVGVANLLSIGQAAFYGIGSYIAAFALITLKLPLIPTILLAMFVTAFISFPIAYVTLRLEGDYFVLATLGFQLIIYALLFNWVSLTGGHHGIRGITPPRLFGIVEISGITPYFIVSSIIALLVAVIFYNLIYSPYGRALKALREDEIALVSLGRNITALKIWAFVISSAFTGIAGFLYASYGRYIDPTSFNLDRALFILSAVLIGGIGNVKGPIVGAIFVVILPEVLSFVGFSDTIAANLRMIIYGLILIVLMRFRPHGLAGEQKYKL